MTDHADLVAAVEKARRHPFWANVRRPHCDDLAALLALHTPHAIYDECEHEHQEGDTGVIDTGEFLTCRAEWLYDICAACCAENPAWVQQSETCATYHEHGKDKPQCPSVGIVRDRLAAWGTLESNNDREQP